MSYAQHTRSQSINTGSDTSPALVADVIVPAALCVEVTVRVPVSSRDAAAPAALEIVRESWAELSVAFTSALRDALLSRGPTVRAIEVVSALAETGPELILRYNAPPDEAENASS